MGLDGTATGPDIDTALAQHEVAMAKKQAKEQKKQLEAELATWLQAQGALVPEGKMQLEDLRQAAAALGLNSKGTKKVVFDRLTAAMAAEAAGGAQDENSGSENEQEDELMPDVVPAAAAAAAGPASAAAQAGEDEDDPNDEFEQPEDFAGESVAVDEALMTNVLGDLTDEEKVYWSKMVAQPAD